LVTTPSRRSSLLPPDFFLMAAAGKENCETGQRMVSFLRMCSSAMPFAVAIVRALPSPALSFFTTLPLPFNPAEYALPIGLNIEHCAEPLILELNIGCGC
jgi:hypothetical protein